MGSLHRLPSGTPPRPAGTLHPLTSRRRPGGATSGAFRSASPAQRRGRPAGGMVGVTTVGRPRAGCQDDAVSEGGVWVKERP